MTKSSAASTPARWLSEHEQSVWRAYLAMVRVVSESLERQLQVDAGMPHTYYLILAMLSEAPERTLRMSELAVISGTSQSRLSHAATRLEEAGWIVRRRCPTDKRGFLATLTDAGLDVLVQTAPGHVNAVRAALFDPLSDDQVKQLRSISDAVVNEAVTTQ